LWIREAGIALPGESAEIDAEMGFFKEFCGVSAQLEGRAIEKRRRDQEAAEKGSS
jgi:hypothetical protein